MFFTPAVAVVTTVILVWGGGGVFLLTKLVTIYDYSATNLSTLVVTS